MLYVSPDAADVEMADTPVSVTTTAANGITRTFNTVVEDDVDQYLTKQDGRIYRQRNEQMCHHGPSGKCFHCVPLEVNIVLSSVHVCSMYIYLNFATFFYGVL